MSAGGNGIARVGTSMMCIMHFHPRAMAVGLTALSSRVWPGNAVPQRQTRTLAVARMFIVRALSCLFYSYAHEDELLRNQLLGI